jgi:multidrug efflux system membrane fusion protein
MDFHFRVGVCLFPLVAALAAAGCRKPAPPPPPPPQVTVSQPVRRSVVESREYSGRLDCVESVEIRARVRGFLEKIHFQEGTEVAKGALLYELESAGYQAAVESAEAEVRRLEAIAKQATSESDRATRLRGTGAVSEEEYAAKTSARDEARANLEKAKAFAENARLDLSYTKITAPIKGRIGRTLVTEGNLVGYNDPTLLTTLVSMDPLYVYFEAPESDYLEYQRLIRDENVGSAEQSGVLIEVGLAIDTGFPHRGLINYRDNRVDRSTGTILIRGRLPNLQRILSPGLYARVRVPFGKPKERLLVPEAALASDQRGRYLLVVKPDNTVDYRPVTTGVAVDGLIVIEKGLNHDDWVIVNGLQKARPGAAVEPQRAEAKAPTNKG